MLAFDDIKPGSRLRGLDAAGIAEVVQVSRFGADALNLVFRVHGRVTERLVYRGEETSFELVEAGRAYAGDQLAIFGEALRELTERATYLYEESGRYWFSTQPTLNRLAEDRAKALPDHEVDAAIAQILRDDATHHRGGFHRVFAAHDDPITVDEAQALSLVILGPSTPHAGRGVAKSPAIDAVTDGLTRCRASQRRFRNTLLYVAADEALLGTARETMRRSLAWASIVGDRRLQDQLTQAQAADARDKAKTGGEGAEKAVRLAWSHVLFPVKTEGTAAGSAFDLEHLSISSKDRAAIPAAVFDKAKGDGIAREKLGPDALALHLKPLWPVDKPHSDWFAAYVYLPKLRDRVVLETAIRDAVAKLDPAFGYADGYDRRQTAIPGWWWQNRRRLCWHHRLSWFAPMLPSNRQRKQARREEHRRPMGGMGESARAPVRATSRPQRSSHAASTAQSRSTWCDQSRHSTRS